MLAFYVRPELYWIFRLRRASVTFSSMKDLLCQKTSISPKQNQEMQLRETLWVARRLDFRQGGVAKSVQIDLIWDFYPAESPELCLPCTIMNMNSSGGGGGCHLLLLLFDQITQGTLKGWWVKCSWLEYSLFLFLPGRCLLPCLHICSLAR